MITIIYVNSDDIQVHIVLTYTRFFNIGTPKFQKLPFSNITIGIILEVQTKTILIYAYSYILVLIVNTV